MCTDLALSPTQLFASPSSTMARALLLLVAALAVAGSLSSTVAAARGLMDANSNGQSSNNQNGQQSSNNGQMSNNQQTSQVVQCAHTAPVSNTCRRVPWSRAKSVGLSPSPCAATCAPRRPRALDSAAASRELLPPGARCPRQAVGLTPYRSLQRRLQRPVRAGGRQLLLRLRLQERGVHVHWPARPTNVPRLGARAPASTPGPLSSHSRAPPAHSHSTTSAPTAGAPECRPRVRLGGGVSRACLVRDRQIVHRKTLSTLDCAGIKLPGSDKNGNVCNLADGSMLQAYVKSRISRLSDCQFDTYLTLYARPPTPAGRAASTAAAPVRYEWRPYAIWPSLTSMNRNSCKACEKT